MRIWDTVKNQCVMTLSGHTSAVKALKWGGAGLLYSASQDRTIRVWSPATGKLVRALTGHGHWVNCLSLNTDYALRAGPYDHSGQAPDQKEWAQKCKDSYDKSVKESGGKELLVSGSDDFTMFLWDPASSKTPIQRLTGHQQPVNYVCFSPDGRYIASASFDTSVGPPTALPPLLCCSAVCWTLAHSFMPSVAVGAGSVMEWVDGQVCGHVSRSRAGRVSGVLECRQPYAGQQQQRLDHESVGSAHQKTQV